MHPRRQGPLVVLESTKPPDGTTRYIDQVVTFAPRRFAFRYISVANLLRPASVFHVHWPEVIVRGRNTGETLARVALLNIALTLMKWRRTAIVRTAHNIEPHEAGGRLERKVLERLDTQTDVFVRINPVTPRIKTSDVLIPHGHYRDRFAGLPKNDPVTGRVIYAGLIRPYKGVEKLIVCFDEVRTAGATLRIVGKPTPELRRAIETAATNSEQITARFGFLPDADFVAEVTSAELVCLPYEELHNSGILLVALSLDRPVLVPDTPSTRALAEEVGNSWIYTFDGTLHAAHIDNALLSIRNGSNRGHPNLEDRSWQRIGARYGEAFERAIIMRRKD